MFSDILTRNMKLWLLGITGFILFVYGTLPILTPFVIGILTAFMLDPTVDRIEAWLVRKIKFKVNMDWKLWKFQILKPIDYKMDKDTARTLGTVIVHLIFFAVVGGAVALIVPIMMKQISAFVGNVAHYTETIKMVVNNTSNYIIAEYDVDENDIQVAKDTIVSYSSTFLGWAGSGLKVVKSSSIAMWDLLMVLFISPIVSFYLIRDWDNLVGWIRDHIPHGSRDEIVTIVKTADTTLSSFFRGQGLVCLFLASFYSISLTWYGLEFGMVIGLASGAISFIPYVGMISGLVASVGMAIVQYQDVAPVLIVAGIYGFGQIVETAYLTPKLVGEKIGLHPVWVIFAILFGGQLAGFTGVLLSVPVAAVVGVVARHFIGEYRETDFFNGKTDEDDDVSQQKS